MRGHTSRHVRRYGKAMYLWKLRACVRFLYCTSTDEHVHSTYMSYHLHSKTDLNELLDQTLLQTKLSMKSTVNRVTKY